jgi:RES domain
VIAPETHLRLRNTWRIIPSRYPSAGILDAIASPEDLDAIIELESWTNDRISAELGLLYRLPREEWLSGRPMATVVMAAFCHPRPGGGRFNSADRGAWYASLSLETAHAEVIFHRTQELAEVGVFETFVQVRAYQADFRAPFHDLRERTGAIYSRTSYRASQSLAARLLEAGSNGVIYRSVRQEGGVCLACFRPRLVLNLRQGAHYEYRWRGHRVPQVRKIG